MSSAGGTPFTVLARGPFARVIATYVEDDLALDPAAVASRWGRALAEARGRVLFPGPVAGLVRFRAGADLELVLRRTDYRAFVATNLSPEHLATGAPCADALGLSIVIRTPDERLLLHRRGAACYEHPLAIDTPGGHVHPDEHGDPIAAAQDELESELGVRPGEVRSLVALGLARIDATRKPQLVLEARIALGHEEVAGRLASAREGYETSELLPGEPSPGALMTPACRAALGFVARP